MIAAFLGFFRTCLTEAHAKLNLRTEAGEYDVVMAVLLFEEVLLSKTGIRLHIIGALIVGHVTLHFLHSIITRCLAKFYKYPLMNSLI